MDNLFEKLKIKPKDRRLYETAFSHSSYVNEHKRKEDYERLEFLGDAVVDLVVADYLYSNLTVDEVRKIGIELGLPYELVYKTPSDGLCGKSDEDNLGFTYSALDEYLRTGNCDNDVKELIDKKHTLNKFKMELMPSYKYGDIKATK